MTMRATFADVVPAVGFEPVVDGRTFDVGISEFAGSSSEGVIPETMSKSPPTGSSACREDEGGVTGVSGADPFVRYIGPLSKSSQSGLIRGNRRRIRCSKSKPGLLRPESKCEKTLDRKSVV